MAQVDFSNAVLDVYRSEKPMTHNDYLRLQNHGFFYNGGSVNEQSGSVSVITNTPTKVSLLYTGTFTASGTEFYIAYTANAGTFKVSNISFSAGDTYAFVIDIEVSGNT